MILIAGLYCYPLKSAGGISLQRAEVTRTGIRFDRQWAVVDNSGMFVAQRGDRGLGIGLRSMCLIKPYFETNDLVLTAPNMPELYLPLEGCEQELEDVQVWETHILAQDQGEAAAEWITEYLYRERKGKYKIVRMPDDEIRKTKRGDGQVAFADGYPLLVISQESLDDLNSRMQLHIGMERFRPNIVLSGCTPYGEDGLSLIGVRNVYMEAVKQCVRCPITTFDQETLARGKEPLRTLATYRRTEKGVVFGTYFVNRGIGSVLLGSEVRVYN